MYGTWTGHQATAIVNPDRIDRVSCAPYGAPKSQILTAGHCRLQNGEPIRGQKSGQRRLWVCPWAVLILPSDPLGPPV